MAINSTKLLPGSKTSTTSKGTAQRMASAFDRNLDMLIDSAQTPSKSLVGQGKKVLIIKTQVIKIENLIKRKYVEESKRKKEDDKNKEKLARKKREEKLEEKPKQDEKLSKVISLPKMGFLDGIKNFLVNLVLGFVAFRLIEHLPKIVKFARILAPAVDFFIDFSGKLLDGLITFIDWGYKAYDATRGFIKKIGGDSTLKVFDAFNGAVGKVIEAAIITSIAIGSQGDGGVLDIGMDMLTDRLMKKGVQQAATGATQAAGSAGGGVGQAAGVGAAGAAAIVAGAGLLASALGEGAFQLKKMSVGMEQGAKKAYDSEKNPLMKPIRWLMYQGAKFISFQLGTVGSLLDIVGTPFRYAIELIRYPFLDENGKKKQALNLAKFDARIREQFREGLNAVSFGLIGGGGKGSWGSLFGEKGTKGMGYAGGGVTRGGKFSGGVKREVKKQKTTRTVKVTPESIEPGKDIGGKIEIEKIFPESKQKDTVSPLGYLSETSNTLGKAAFFGPLFSIALKTILGDKPNNLDYKNVGIGLNAWLSRTLSSSGGFAGGGEVDTSMFMNGEDYSNVIASSVKDSVSYEIDKTIKDLMQNLMLKPMEDGKAGGGNKSQEGDLPPGTGSLTGNTNAEKVFNYLVSYGFTPQAAAGVIGNLMQESGVNPNSNQHGGGPGRGIMQWGTGPGSGQRWDALTAWAQASGKDPRSLDTQVEWMMKEMHQRGTFKRLKGLTNVKAATDLFEKEMEGAGTPMMENRYKHAADALASFGGGTAGGTGMAGMDRGGVGGSIAEYITGDPNTPFGRFDRAGHGTPGNYHDHIAFKDRNTAVSAYNFFKSKGIQVTEFKGFDSVGGHASGSYHYSGLAFDVPGAQWGGSGAIGSRDYAGSAKVRNVLKQFMGGDVKLEKGGLVGGMTRAMIGEKGPEYVLDSDTTLSLNTNMPGFLDKLNRAKNIRNILGVIQSYASYEDGAESEVVLPDNYGSSDESENMMPKSSQFVPVPMGGSGSSDPFAVLDRLPG
jgi:hypothetical protein